MRRLPISTPNWVIGFAIALFIAVLAVLCLGWSNDRFVEECEKKNGTVGTTSNGYRTCTFDK